MMREDWTNLIVKTLSEGTLVANGEKGAAGFVCRPGMRRAPESEYILLTRLELEMKCCREI